MHSAIVELLSCCCHFEQQIAETQFCMHKTTKGQTGQVRIAGQQATQLQKWQAIKPIKQANWSQRHAKCTALVGPNSFTGQIVRGRGSKALHSIAALQHTERRFKVTACSEKEHKGPHLEGAEIEQTCGT